MHLTVSSSNVFPNCPGTAKRGGAALESHPGNNPVLSMHGQLASSTVAKSLTPIGNPSNGFEPCSALSACLKILPLLETQCLCGVCFKLW
eukprot:1351315-Amphidinium_carterae.1